MATIGIDIKTNFDEAGADLKNFSTLSSKESKRVADDMQKYEIAMADKFVKKNKLVALSVHETRGASAALVTEQRGLERKMQTLIRNGMDPQAAALQKLRGEYDRTTRQIEVNTKVQKINAGAQKAAKATLAAMGVAAVGVGVALFKNAQDTAKRGDAYAKQSAIIGTTAEEYQKLIYVASIAGVSQEQLSTAMQKLNKNIGDARTGTGSLNTILAASNPQLLKQLQSTTDTGKAFDLVVGQLNKMTNAQDRAALAQAAFGKAGQALTNISSMSAEEIAKLKDEAVKYGIISNSSAKSSEDFMDAQTRMEAAITGVRNSLGAALMPIIKSVVEWFTKLVGNGKEIENFFRKFGPVIIGVAAALAAMLIVSKVISLVQGFKTAMVALKVVMMQHPVFLLAAALVAIVALFSSSGKSADDFEKEIAGAEATTKRLKEATEIQSASFKSFSVAAKSAAVGSEVYEKSLQALLQKTPDLAKYGITATSSFEEVAAAQQMLTDSQQAAAVVSADKEYNKLADSLGSLRGKLLDAYEVYKSDPTTANLAAAQQYASQVKRSETAMMSLGQQSGRSAGEIQSAIQSAGAKIGGFTLSAQYATDAVNGIGLAAKNARGYWDELSTLSTSVQRKQLQSSIAMGIQMGKDVSRMQAALVALDKKPTLSPDTNKDKGGYNKPKDMSNEIRALRDANELRLKYADETDRKIAELRLAADRKEQDLIAASDVFKDDRIAYMIEARKKLEDDIYKITEASDKKIAELKKKTEDDITKKHNEEVKKRMDFAGQMIEAVSQISNALAGLFQAQNAAELKTLEEKQAAELTGRKMSNKQKEKLEKEHEKAKAKLEYEGALRAWKMQVAAGIADGARAILSALTTKPFIPVGLASAGVAAAMGGIQIATLKASKPKLSAETGGRFTVPSNPNSSRGDSQTMAVNPGEQIEVLARGEAGRKSLTVNNFFDKRLLWSCTQEGIDSGEITITNDNLVAV